MKKISVDDYNDEFVVEALKQNSLGRNKNINTMLTFLNNIEGQLVLNINGAWGTGKTVFLKQLAFLHDNESTLVEKILPDNIRRFRDKYTLLYFNAWANDLYDNPLESLIFEMIFKIEETDKDESVIRSRVEKIDALLKKVGILAGDVVLKSISGGTVTLESLKIKKEDLAPSITSVNVKKKALIELINYLSELANKKILVMIDELDRCKPSFAVKLLEVIKHFFDNENIVFLFATNKTELSNTVRLSYGIEFDGYKYLNRFFDFEFSLPIVSVKDYVMMKYSGSLPWTHFRGKAILAVSSYFNFSMRDIDRYVSSCLILNNYWDRKPSMFYDSHYFVEWVMLPYATGLKINSGVAFNNFISGNGFRDFLEFCLTDPDFQKSRLFTTEPTKDFNFEENAKEVYELIRGKGTSSNESLIYVLDTMVDLLTMMSSYTDDV